MCRNNLNVDVSHDDIIKCYRVGKNKETPRPAIFKFEKLSTKNLILKNVGKLKGTTVGIAEDLMKKQLEVYRAAQKITNRKSVFTRFGNVFVKIDGKVHKISDISLLREIVGVNE